MLIVYLFYYYFVPFAIGLSTITAHKPWCMVQAIHSLGGGMQ